MRTMQDLVGARITRLKRDDNGMISIMLDDGVYAFEINPAQVMYNKRPVPYKEGEKPLGEA